MEEYFLVRVVYKAEWCELIETNQSDWKMKISVAVLTLSLCYLSVAEVQLVEDRAGEANTPEVRSYEPAILCAGDITELALSPPGSNPG